ncbi:MAG: DEAD/DEAH box helicase [Candidatus Hodarchaeales archaeon]|jgi:replicative superfamily II helicase
MSFSDNNFPDIPKPFLKLFPQSLNKVQQLSYPDIWHTDSNIVVQAPTGSGKTVIAQLAILKALLKPSKAIFLGPLRALNQEKFSELKKFRQFNWIVQIVLGGSHSPVLSECDILLSTPEKFLSLLFSLDFSSFPVSVILIDEIHLLGEGKRGAYLEYLLLFLKTFHPTIRLVGLSATIPNCNQLAEWLQATPLIYDDSFRATNLVTKFIDLPDSMQEKFGRMVKAYQISKKFHPNQSLIFTTSRANVHFYAKMFLSWAERDELPLHPKIDFKNARLTQLSRYGISFYHAGLSESDKQLIVHEYNNNNLRILISTSSLAWGVNLPAKAVIVADLEYNNPLTGKELMSSSDILQMLGRAGRPQFHDKGYGYIIVSDNQKTTIQAIIEGNAPIRSSIRDFIPELLLLFFTHLTSQTTISLDEVYDFFEHSFLIKAKLTSLSDLYQQVKNALSYSLDIFFVKENDNISLTPIGIATSKFFINPRTAHNLVLRKPDQDNISEILSLITEFADIPIRTSEKKTLRMLGATPTSYREIKLLHIIKTLNHNEKLSQEFAEDGKIIYQEYKRINSFYSSIFNDIIEIS